MTGVQTCALPISLIVKGTLTISGDHNELEDVIVGGASGPGVIITGHHNKVTVMTTNNGGDGVHLAGAVTNTVMHTVIADQNTGHGIYAGPGVTGTSLDPAVAVRNGLSGVFLEGCLATTLNFVQSGFNMNFGILVSAVDDARTTINCLAQGNTRSGLCLSNGTSRLRCMGAIFSGSVGLELNGAGVTRNSIDMSINGCSADGARLFAGQSNELTLAIGNCAGHGL